MILWISLGVSLVLAIVVAIIESRDRVYGEPAAAFARTLIFCGFVSLMVCFIASWIWGTSGVHEDHSNLKAIGTNESMKGSFFLASGNFQDVESYKFIKETDDGGFFMKSVPISSAVIYEIEAGDQPHMVRLEEYRNSPWVPWEYSMPATYEFHVPENSVVESFKIDVND